MQPVKVNQAQATIQEVVGLVVFEDKQGLINLLRKNGATIDDNISDENLIKVTYLAIAKSNGFKKDFSTYLVGKFSEEKVEYVADGEFFNFGEDGDKKKSGLFAKKEGGSGVGNALRKVGTEENINSLVNTGLGILSKKLTAKADQQSIKDATELASKKSEQALAEANLQAQKSASKKWVVPVVIASVLVVGAVIYFVIRKKK
jgi:hypothetical protein